MGKWLKTSCLATLGLGVVSVCWLIFNLIAYEYIRPVTINFEKPEPNIEILAAVVSLGFLVVLIFHLFGILTIIQQMRIFGNESSMRRATLLAGIISFMTIFGDFGLLNDIGKESQIGVDVSGEWICLYLTLIPQIIFFILMFITAGTGFRALRNLTETDSVFRDETVFYAVHYTGLLCGAIGLCMAFMMFVVRTALWNLKYIVVYYNVFIVAPYFLIAFYWLFMKRNERVREWYDEKQFFDISKAGFLTLMVSLPVMAGLYVINYLLPDGRAGILWFPFYLHLVLSFFSGTTLYLRES
jgi:hypothetical protein